MTSHKSFKKAAGLMLVAVLASRLLGLVREMLIARQFGQGGEVSAYTAAFNIPDLLYFFLSSGALSAAFIPEFTRRFETGKQKEAWQVFSIITCFMGVVLTAAVVLAWIFAKPLASLLSVPGFVEGDPELVQLTVNLTRIILPCQLFFFLGGVMSATLEARQKFSARAAGPVIYNIGIIFGAIVLSRWFDIAGLAIGTLIGAFAGNIAYAYYCMRKEGFEFYPSLNIRHPGVIRVAKLALPVILGLGLPQIDVIVNKWFASYVSSSAPAALNFANRLMQVPLGIFAQAAGTAILPMLAAYAARNALDDMRSGVAYGLRAIMVESIPATVFIIVMADPLVRTIYMSGEFRPSSVGLTVVPLIWYSVGIYAWAGQAIVARGFFALQDTVTPVVIGTVSTIIFIPLNWILMHAMGTGGIALSTSIGISIHFLALTWFLKKRLYGIEGRKTLSTVGRILLAAVVMGAICIGVRIGMSRTVGSWQLQDGDVKDPIRFAVELRRGDTPLSASLYSKLSDDTVRMLDAKRASGSSLQLQMSILHDLNAAIRTEANRRLLEVAYPAQIVPRPIDRVESRMGSMLTVLLAMIVGAAAYFALLRLFKVDELDYLWEALRSRIFRRSNGGGQPPVEVIESEP
ncbi:MAG: murein biosynthesis integral membrane protein MurJ [Armatimonadetes bacterium]|nr:murein biosynthesis integral membrane protein MurJ [Armatimonadota bacterium]